MATLILIAYDIESSFLFKFFVILEPESESELIKRWLTLLVTHMTS